MFLAAETLMTSNTQRLRILRPCLLTASPTTRSRLLCPRSSILVGFGIHAARAPLAGRPPSPSFARRASRDRRLYYILRSNSLQDSTLLFWGTPRSASLACVCLIDNMRWKHLAVLFVRRRTRFFELVSFPPSRSRSRHPYRRVAC